MASVFSIYLYFLGSISLGFSELVVKLDVGRLHGTEMKSDNGKIFYAFRGIPYAEPPTAKLRFKPPVTKLSWSDEILNATQDGPICPQMDLFTNTFVGQEDNCLVLNVYTPQISDSTNSKLRPVMVHIHGGCFALGTGSSESYGPKKLLDNDIVLVTLNYRLGPLGFLSTSDSESPGNYGVLDQLEALKWVNNHIVHFGGDVQRITITGGSAGAASVIYHLLSPLSNGLFQNAIAFSGSALCPWGFQPEPLVWAQKVGIQVGCPVHDTEKMMKCLRYVSAKNLTENGYSFNVGYFPIVFAPTIDNYFLLDNPHNLLEKGMINNVESFMTSITKDEALIQYAWLLKERGPRPFANKKEVKLALKDNIGTTLYNSKAVELMYNEYLENLNIDDVEATRDTYVKVSSDGLFEMCHYHTAQLMAKAGVKTYSMKYDYQAPFSFNQLNGQETMGVSHVDDLFMLFHGSMFDHATFDDKSEKIKNIYQSLLINFLNTSNPTPKVSDDSVLEWTPVEPTKHWVYHVDDPISSVVYEPERDPSYKFWIERIPKAIKESRIKPKEKAKDEL